MKIARYGWQPDLPDARDGPFMYAPMLARRRFPKVYDQRPSPNMPTVYDQSTAGSCVGNSSEALMRYVRRKQGLEDIAGSRLFVYYNARAYEGTQDYDAGCQIRDGIKGLAKLGVCPETGDQSNDWWWPYDVSQVTTKPRDDCYSAAIKDVAVSYHRIPRNITSMKSCLAEDYPFVFGFSVYESFESDEVAETGIVQMPKTRNGRITEDLLGGHAVMCVGYDTTVKPHRFIVRNSWGPDWGQGGYFTMPFDYLTDANLADDMWTVRLVSA